MLRKLKWQIPGERLAARYNWCQGPVPGRGPAVDKHWYRRLGGLQGPSGRLRKFSPPQGFDPRTFCYNNYAIPAHRGYCIFRICAFMLSYSACKAHAPYCHLWPVRLHHIFPHYLINGTIFVEKIIEQKCVLWFSPQLLSKTSLILRRTERDIMNVPWSSCKVAGFFFGF